MSGVTQSSKARYWVGVLYTENMRSDWEEEIANLLQIPYAYCIHDVDLDVKSEHRKKHVHLMLVFPNTTTYKHAMSVFQTLSADGKQAINTCQRVIGVRNQYDYLIHDTEDCRKKGKHLYQASERVTGNNFDIGSYEQITLADKDRMCSEIEDAVLEYGFTTYAQVFKFVKSNYDDEYRKVLRSYSGHFARLCKGNFFDSGGIHPDE